MKNDTIISIVIVVAILVFLAIPVTAFILIPTTIYINEKTVAYEPDYLIKGIPAEFDGKTGDFFVSGVTCSRSSDSCTVYSQAAPFEYTYPVNNTFMILRTEPSWHVKLFINSPEARSAEQAKLTR